MAALQTRPVVSMHPDLPRAGAGESASFLPATLGGFEFARDRAQSGGARVLVGLGKRKATCSAGLRLLPRIAARRSQGCQRAPGPAIALAPDAERPFAEHAPKPCARARCCISRAAVVDARSGFSESALFAARLLVFNRLLLLSWGFSCTFCSCLVSN